MPHPSYLRCIVALLFASFASVAAAAGVVDAVVKVHVGYGNEGSYLSGVVTDVVPAGDRFRVYVMTNAHGFREGQPQTLEVFPPSHPPITCDRIEYMGDPDQKADDLAVISGVTARPPPSAPLADASPQPGMRVDLTGYPAGGRLSIRPARRTAIQTSGGDVFDAPAEQGMSGGPVFYRGRVCGLIWGSSVPSASCVDGSCGPSTGSQCYAVPLPRIRAVLQRIRGSIAAIVAPPRSPTPQYQSPQYQAPQYSTPPAVARGGGVVWDPDMVDVPQPRLPMAPATADVTVRVDPPPPPEPADVLPREPSPPVSSVPAVTQPVPPAGTAATGWDWPDIAAKAVVAVAGIMGVAIPPALVIGWRAVSAIHRRRSGRDTSMHPSGYPPGTSTNPYAAPPIDPVIVRDQAPPPPQVIYSDRQFTQYETDRFSKAYDWARQRLMVDYPGSRFTLEQMHSMIQQHLAGQRRPKNTEG
ncbi:hypothetical protein V7x_28620 [Crateriforma conspicua]|uniref:Trypsin n=1 Tax=Crateriforma conspicua TaxID=2527996 RepID=A0A5C6G0Y2_9PLAN|nr:serine protease [Crateriforma conspicua]TWU67288.1 hypothetical protein V7x_28620 [Crateriforma conspicua]